jgi:hypothetical protein
VALVSCKQLTEFGVYGPTDMGTGRSLRPDYKEAAKRWHQEGPGTKDRTAWEEYATRMGLMPDDIEKGWAFLAGRMRESVEVLLSILGENTSWSGGLVEGGAATWSGYQLANPALVHTPSTPAPFPGFGFHTKSAEKVWDYAKHIAAENPTSKTDAIIGWALEASKVLAMELTPEDVKMLEMAINWYIAGKHWDDNPKDRNPQIAGMPAGPFRSVAYGHELAGKGAP